jgi:hypothetical protein
VTVPVIFRPSRTIFFCALLLLAFAGMTVTVLAQNTAISRGFIAKSESIVQGAIVSSDDKNSETVALADTQNSKHLTGVVSKSTLLELSEGKQREVQVILSGTAVALVSDINGSIRAGDKITASPIEGVGMLATESTQIVGTAKAGLDTPRASTKEITDKNGKRHTVHIDTIPVQVEVTYYAAPASQFLPPFLQNLANSIAGRPVSGVRILLGGVLLLMAFISLFALVFTSVRSGLISLGRNPMAAGAIHRSLVGVGITTALVAIFSLVAVYLILIY